MNWISPDLLSIFFSFHFFFSFNKSLVSNTLTYTKYSNKYSNIRFVRNKGSNERPVMDPEEEGVSPGFFQ